MLRQIRGKLNSIFVLLLMGLLIASFAIWGIGDIFRGGGSNVIAKVGDQEITAQDFIQRFQQAVRAQQAQNPEFTNELAMTYGFDRQLLAVMIRGAALDAAAQNMGLRVSDKQIAKEIAAIPAFQVGGQFNKSTYEIALSQKGISERALFEDTRKSKTRELMAGAMEGNAYVPDVMAAQIYRFQNERRVATVVTVPAGKVGEIEAPEDKALEDYYTEHQDRYMAPELRSFDYAMVSVDDLQDQVEVSEEDLEKAYENRKDQYQTPELRRLDQVVFDNAEDADSFVSKIEAGGAYTELAKQVGGLSEDDLSLGDLAYSDIENEYGKAAADAVFNLNEGGVSQPQKTAFGWHVFRVGHIAPGKSQDFEDVRGDLLANLKKERAIDLLSERANAIDDAFASGATFEEAAKKFHLKAGSFKDVSQNGADITGASVQGIDRARPLLPTVFSQEVNPPLELTPMGDDAYAIVRTTGIQDARQQSFEDVKAKVLAQWKIEELGRRTKALADDLVAKVKAGANLEQTAANAGYPVSRGVSLTRQDVMRGNAGNTAAARQLFQLPEGDLAAAPNAANNAVLVVRNDDIQAADPAQDPQGVAALKAELEKANRFDLEQEYLTALQRQYGLELNQKLWQDVRRQLGATDVPAG